MNKSGGINGIQLLELIETLWNVNIKCSKHAETARQELIETLWNVNQYSNITGKIVDLN